nr:MAG TPA_asm: cellulose biosynthesis protein [Caudoviricetes sp.]
MGDVEVYTSTSPMISHLRKSAPHIWGFFENYFLSERAVKPLALAMGI